MAEKISWGGELISIQPRIRLNPKIPHHGSECQKIWLCTASGDIVDLTLGLIPASAGVVSGVVEWLSK